MATTSRAERKRRRMQCLQEMKNGRSRGDLIDFLVSNYDLSRRSAISDISWADKELIKAWETTESKEIIPFLEILSVQKARQAYRPEYFSQSLASSLSIDEVEDIWSCISERDDWTKFEKKIKIIKNYGAALRLE